MVEEKKPAAKRRRIEKEMIFERNLLRSLLDELPDSVYFKDKEHKFVAVSKAKAEHHGLSPEDFVGKTDFDFFPEECARKMYEADDQVLKTGKSIVDREEKVTHPDGSVHWYSVTKVPYKDNEGNIIGTLGISRDITERKRAEEARKKSEEKYKKQFEEALDAIFIADAETGIIIDCNRAACELVGREKSELVGKHQRNLHPPEKIEGEFTTTFKQHLKEKEGQVLEAQVITKKGEIKDVAIKANIFEFRGKKVLQGIFRDITDRKRVEKELAQERDLLHVLMDNIPDAIYFKDAASRFTMINKAEAHLLGVKDPEEVVGKTDFNYFAEEHARDAFADEQKIVKTGQALINKVEKSERPDGYFIWHSTTKVPIKDKEGNIIGTMGISRNITDSKLVQDELAQERDLLHVLMDNIPDAIYYKDTASRFTRINKAEARLLGVKDIEEVVGKTDFDYFTEEHARDAFADEKKIMKTEQALINKVEKSERPDGYFIWHSTTKVPIKDKEGRVIGIVGISRDITERKQLEEELKQASAAIAEISLKRDEEIKRLKQRIAELEKK